MGSAGIEPTTFRSGGERATIAPTPLIPIPEILAQLVKSDTFTRNTITGAAISKDDPTVELLVKAWAKGHICLNPELVKQMLDWPSTYNPRAIWSNALSSDIPIHKYRPAMGRTLQCTTSTEDIRWDRWGINSDNSEGNNEGSTPRPAPKWTSLHKTPLEPKHISLLWSMRYGIVATAKLLAHFVPNKSSSCMNCEAGEETLSHYFWDCKHANRFWLLIARFLQAIRTNKSGTPFQITKEMVVSGFGGWKATIPNPDATNGLGVWELYRYHAETNLNGTKRTGDAMFIRWKSTLMSRIVHDFSYSFTIKKKAHLFKKRWLQVSNQWFQFDPGGEELSGKLSFISLPYETDHRLHHLQVNYQPDNVDTFNIGPSPATAEPAAQRRASSA
ncbi:hypothetical protein GGI25_000092 [Coemansia spiralis]|uniref:Reverse transcriptase zinc-binding domain-containing protein n=1 Tax=Coemansia spiralis TaxID=417178 RepID=A0A9W8GF10_9FUNG|nr:hypothetical protein GGI25_000092 [Coemansia spiralis]